MSRNGLNIPQMVASVTSIWKVASPVQRGNVRLTRYVIRDTAMPSAADCATDRDEYKQYLL